MFEKELQKEADSKKASVLTMQDNGRWLMQNMYTVDSRYVILWYSLVCNVDDCIDSLLIVDVFAPVQTQSTSYVWLGTVLVTGWFRNSSVNGMFVIGVGVVCILWKVFQHPLQIVLEKSSQGNSKLFK